MDAFGMVALAVIRVPLLTKSSGTKKFGTIVQEIDVLLNSFDAKAGECFAYGLINCVNMKERL